MSNFMGLDIFWIGLNQAGLGCWRLTLNLDKFGVGSYIPDC